jgi:hypothetical protein
VSHKVKNIQWNERRNKREREKLLVLMCVSWKNVENERKEKRVRAKWRIRRSRKENWLWMSKIECFRIWKKNYYKVRVKLSVKNLYADK